MGLFGKKGPNVRDLNEDDRYILVTLYHQTKEGIGNGRYVSRNDLEDRRPYYGDASEADVEMASSMHPIGTLDKKALEALHRVRQRPASLYRSTQKLKQIGLIKTEPLEDHGLAYTLTPEGKKIAVGVLKRHPNERGLERITSFIFLLAGLFFMAVPEFTATGNIIGNSAGANISFFLSLGLMVIGGVLLFQSLRRK